MTDTYTPGFYECSMQDITMAYAVRKKLNSEIETIIEGRWLDENGKRRPDGDWLTGKTIENETTPNGTEYPVLHYEEGEYRVNIIPYDYLIEIRWGQCFYMETPLLDNEFDFLIGKIGDLPISL